MDFVKPCSVDDLDHDGILSNHVMYKLLVRGVLKLYFVHKEYVKVQRQISVHVLDGFWYFYDV